MNFCFASTLLGRWSNSALLLHSWKSQKLIWPRWLWATSINPHNKDAYRLTERCTEWTQPDSRMKLLKARWTHAWRKSKNVNKRWDWIHALLMTILPSSVTASAARTNLIWKDLLVRKLHLSFAMHLAPDCKVRWQDWNRSLCDTNGEHVTPTYVRG